MSARTESWSRGRREREASGMLPAVIVFAYLAIVVYIGIFAFRKAPGREEVEDYFLANRSLGPFVFLMSLFGPGLSATADIVTGRRTILSYLISPIDEAMSEAARER